MRSRPHAYSSAMPFSANSFCFLVLGQVHQAHSTQHIGRLGELDVVVTDDLHSITPGVPKIKEGTVKWSNTSCLECLAGRLLVVDDETEVTTIVCGLLAAFLQGNELIAQVDERHRGTLAAQFEFEKAAVERQRLVDIADLQRDVVEAYGARLRKLSHRNLLCQSGD